MRLNTTNPAPRSQHHEASTTKPTPRSQHHEANTTKPAPQAQDHEYEDTGNRDKRKQDDGNHWIHEHLAYGHHACKMLCMGLCVSDPRISIVPTLVASNFKTTTQNEPKLCSVYIRTSQPIFSSSILRPRPSTCPVSIQFSTVCDTTSSS